ncbi:MAG: glycosyltransferase family 39 protein, partial [Anaerolineaceae bacterium]|nr:glycosyltransferase family 39 protein [Anaerolineaceae bacterium]
MEFFLIFIITGVGFFFRYWRLATIPSGIDGDIASMGLQALEIIHKPILDWFGVGWSGHSMLFFQPSILSMRIFGETLSGLLAASVFLGTLCIPAIYLLGRELFGYKTGLLAAFLLAVSYTDIQFSRSVSIEDASLGLIVMAYTLIKALRSGKSVWYSLAGFFLGVCLFAYYPIRIAPLLVILLFIWLIIWDRKAIRGNYHNWAAFTGASLIGFGPQLAFAFSQFRTFVGRGNDVTIFNPDVSIHLLGKYHISSIAQLLLEQIKRSFLVYSNYGDSSTFFGYRGGMINFLTGMFLILGICFCLFRLKDVRHFVLIAWLGLALILGGVITNDPPFWPHLVITLPAVMILAGYAITLVWSYVSPYLTKPVRVASTIGLASILILTGIQNWQTYLGFVQDNAGPRVRIARFLSSLSPDYQVHFMSGDFGWEDREFQFMNRGMNGDDLVLDQNWIKNSSSLNVPTVFILTQDRFSNLPILEQVYPLGVLQDHFESTGWLAFKSYIVIPAHYQPLPPPANNPRQNWFLIVLLGLVVAAYLALLAYYFWGKVTRRLIHGRQQPIPSPVEKPITINSHQARTTPWITNAVLPLPISIATPPGTFISPDNQRDNQSRFSPWLLVATITSIGSVYTLLNLYIHQHFSSPVSTPEITVTQAQIGARHLRNQNGIHHNLNRISSISPKWLILGSIISAFTSLYILIRLRFTHRDRNALIFRIDRNQPHKDEKIEQVQLKNLVAVDANRDGETINEKPHLSNHRFPKWPIFAPLLFLMVVFFGQIILDANTNGELAVNFRWLTGMDESTRVWIGLLVLILGFLSWLFATPTDNDAHRSSMAQSDTQEGEVFCSGFEIFKGKQAFSIQLFGSLTSWMGILSYCFSMVLFIVEGENGLVQFFWFAGVCLFILSQGILWILSRSKRPSGITWRTPSFPQVFLFLLILATGLLLRFYRLADIPSDFHGDMASHGLMARDLLSGNVTQIFHDGWASIPNMAFIPAAISLKVFGNNLFG